MSKNDGGPAFPITIDLGQSVEFHKGVSVRDYFAGQAVIGLVARPGFVDADYTASFAYKVADAMLKERQK